MDLRDFRGTCLLILFGLLPGCAGSIHSVSTPTEQADSSASEEEKARQDALDKTARLVLAARQEPAQEKWRPGDPATTKGPTRVGSAGITLAAVPLNSRDPEVLTDMGVLALQKGDLATAEKSFRAVLEIAPNHQRATLQLGLTLGRQGRNEEAARLFGAGKPIDPSRPDTDNRLARVDKPVEPLPPAPLPPSISTVETKNPGLPLLCDPAAAVISTPPVERGEFKTLPPTTPAIVDRAAPIRPPAPPVTLPPAPPVIAEKTTSLPNGEPLPTLGLAVKHEPPETPPSRPETDEPKQPAALVENKPDSSPPVPPPPVAPSAPAEVREEPVAVVQPPVQPAPRLSPARLQPPEAEPDTPAAAPPPVVTVAAPVVEPEAPAAVPTALSPVRTAPQPALSSVPSFAPTPVAPIPAAPPTVQPAVAPPIAAAPAPVEPPPVAPSVTSVVLPPISTAGTGPELPPAPPVVKPTPAPEPTVKRDTELPLAPPVSKPAPVPANVLANGPYLPPAPPVSKPAPPTAVATGSELPLAPPVLQPPPALMPAVATKPMPTPTPTTRPAVLPPIVQASAPQPLVKPWPDERDDVYNLNPVPKPAPVAVPPAPPPVRVIITDVKAE